MRILLIEDEYTLRQQLINKLQTVGYVVDSASDGEEGLYLGQEFPVDAAIIDIGLPKLSGLEVIQRLRAEDKNFPVIILTARGRWQEKVEGLEAGADDYLTKPFEMEELLARLRALLRRAAGQSSPTVQCGSITLDTRSQTVSVNEDSITLTSYEYKVLEYLMLHQGEVISKTVLTDHIYAQDHDRDSNVIEVFIKRLRHKLDPNHSLNPIETLRGRGYRMAL